jgi:hypothetical protein
LFLVEVWEIKSQFFVSPVSRVKGVSLDHSGLVLLAQLESLVRCLFRELLVELQTKQDRARVDPLQSPGLLNNPNFKREIFQVNPNFNGTYP